MIAERVKGRTTKKLTAKVDWRLKSSLPPWWAAQPSKQRVMGSHRGPGRHSFINSIFFQISVESIDDKEDMQFADEAFDILGFNKEEKYNVYKLTASVMHLGEMKFKKKSAKDDQATADGTKAGEKVATLLGVKVDDLYENFERPKIKVGAEWVTKVQKF